MNAFARGKKALKNKSRVPFSRELAARGQLVLARWRLPMGPVSMTLGAPARRSRAKRG
jgi:hypothetical protein